MAVIGFMIQAPGLNNALPMDKLKLPGQNLGRVFNSRCGCARLCIAITLITKQPNLNLKTQPENTKRGRISVQLISHLTCSD
jgi:hypothetical protein